MTRVQWNEELVLDKVSYVTFEKQEEELTMLAYPAANVWDLVFLFSRGFLHGFLMEIHIVDIMEFHGTIHEAT